MATPVIMPRQGQSVESCVITSWEKKVGDKVAVGDVLFSYETDKSAFDEVSTVEGTLLSIFYEEGDDVECLLNVCVIGNEGEDISEFMPKSDNTASEQEIKEPETVKQPEQTTVFSAEPVKGDITKISPRAKALAEKTGANLDYAVATGPNGRIIERDINALLDAGLRGKVETANVSAAAPADVEYVDEKLSNMRKVIAKAMHASLSESAQLTLNTSFDATKLIALRASLKSNGEKYGLEKITYNDMILYAVAKTVVNHRAVNAHFLDDKMRFFTNAHIGVAVDTDRGLIVPTIFNANLMSLPELSKEAKALAKEAKAGSISPDKIKGASFTVSNLGSFGIESFTPVINPPQTCILGVNNITRKIKEVDGKDIFYNAMGLSLTFDHRALDGADAARFLKDLCSNLESFDLLTLVNN